MSIRAHATAFVSMGLVAAMSGCLAPRAVDLEGKECPCADGWACDTATDTCVFGGSTGGPDGAVADTGGGGDTGGGDTSAMPDGAGTDTMMPGAVMLYYEAEDGMITAPMATGDDPMASGGSYVSSAAADADGATPAVSDGRVRITVDIPADGTYRVWGRALTGPEVKNPKTMAVNNDPNSFWVCMDVDPPVAAECANWNTIPGNAAWGWDDMHNVDVVIDFTLTAGTHQLDVYAREANTRLDRVLVTDDLTLTAADLP